MIDIKVLRKSQEMFINIRDFYFPFSEQMLLSTFYLIFMINSTKMMMLQTATPAINSMIIVLFFFWVSLKVLSCMEVCPPWEDPLNQVLLPPIRSFSGHSVSRRGCSSQPVFIVVHRY